MTERGKDQFALNFRDRVANKLLNNKRSLDRNPLIANDMFRARGPHPPPPLPPLPQGLIRPTKIGPTSQMRVTGWAPRRPRPCPTRLWRSASADFASRHHW